MNKIYLLGSLVLLVPFNSLAQAYQALNGTVYSDKGVKLPGALVSVKGTYLVDGTDDEGHFHINGNFTQGTVLVVSYVGYETQEVPYTPGPGQSLAMGITLQPNRELSEVIVAASRVEENIGQVPVTVDKLDHQLVENITTPDLTVSKSMVAAVENKV